MRMTILMVLSFLLSACAYEEQKVAVTEPMSVRQDSCAAGFDQVMSGLEAKMAQTNAPVSR